MVKPTGGSGQRKTYIAVGYGLEAVIPDITAKEIVSNEIIPGFKSGDNYHALDAATSILISLAKKEFSYEDYKKQTATDYGNWMPFGIFLVIMIFYIIMSFRRSGYTMGSGGRTYYGGGWSNWGGGGFGGGSSGGGFGGGSFGGGSFGGGGAGGSW